MVDIWNFLNREIAFLLERRWNHVAWFSRELEMLIIAQHHLIELPVEYLGGIYMKKLLLGFP